MNRTEGKWRNRNIFHYIVAVSTVLLLIFLSMGIYIYQYYYHTIYADFLAANERTLDYIMTRHESEMKILKNIVIQMNVETNITRFRLEETPEKSLKLRDRLNQYWIASEFFEFIFYCYHRDHYVFNQNTSLEIDSFLNKGLVLEENSRGMFKEFLYDESGEMLALPEQEVCGYLQAGYLVSEQSTIYMLPVLPDNIGTAVFVVNQKFYNELLGSEAKERRNNYILYDGQIIVSRENFDTEADELLRQTAVMEAVQQKQGKVTIGGEHYLLTAERGVSGLTYCTLQTMDVFREKILSEQWGILFLLLVCSVPAAIAVVSASRAVSTRVKRLNMLLNQKEDSYNYDSIESGIQMLTKSSQESTRENLNHRKSGFIRSFVQSDYRKDEIYRAARNSGFLLEDISLFLVVLMGDRGDGNGGRIHTLMLQEIEKENTVEGWQVGLINSGQSLYVLFGRERESMEEVLQRLFTCGQEHCEEFIMAVSEYHEDFEEGAKAYLEADAAYDNRFLEDNSMMLRFSSLGGPGTVEMLPDVYLYNLKKAIRSGSMPEVQRTVGDICNRVKQGNQTLLTFRIMYNDLLHLLLEEFKDVGTDLKDVYNVFMLSQCLNIHDFSDILCEACRMLMDNRRATAKEQDNMAARAVSYMQENFGNPELNMGMLAEYLGISPVTLAVEFRNSENISPSDYLVAIRMEKAKELLENTKLLVKEVSQAVGYEDDHVFMRRFKKYVGKTPKEYRMGRM